MVKTHYDRAGTVTALGNEEVDGSFGGKVRDIQYTREGGTRWTFRMGRI